MSAPLVTALVVPVGQEAKMFVPEAKAAMLVPAMVKVVTVAEVRVKVDITEEPT
jgi:hypothetical protein